MAGRIRIESYKSLDVRAPAVPGGGYIRVDASAASPDKFGPSPLMKQVLDVAQGLPGFVQGVSEHLALDDEAAVREADARLGEREQALLFDPQDGYFNTKGETALTKAPEVLDAYTKAQEREVDALLNDEQRQMLEDLAQRRLTTFGEQVERHSAAERQRWYDDVGDRRIAQMRADAGFYWSDDVLLRRALGTDAKGEAVYRHPQTGEYIKRVTDPRTPGVWEKFDKDGKRLGIYDYSLRMPFRDPPPIVPFVPSPPAVPQLPVLPPRPALGPSIVPARGLPPAGILPPVSNPGALRVGPASRPSEAAKGGMSLYERSGAEWRWYPGDRRHHPHWDYNSHRTPNSPWLNFPHGGMMDHMKLR